MTASELLVAQESRDVPGIAGPASPIDAIIDQDPSAEVRAAVETMADLFGRSAWRPVSTTIPARIFTPESV